jgi:hypothetical protein
MFSLQKNLQVTAGKVVRLRCESRGGNPPAGLKWFIDEEQLQGRVRLRLEIQLRLFKCDVLAIALLRIKILLPSLLSLPQNLDKNQNLDKQVNSKVNKEFLPKNPPNNPPKKSSQKILQKILPKNPPKKN